MVVGSGRHHMARPHREHRDGVRPVPGRPGDGPVADRARFRGAGGLPRDVDDHGAARREHHPLVRSPARDRDLRRDQRLLPRGHDVASDRADRDRRDRLARDLDPGRHRLPAGDGAALPAAASENTPAARRGAGRPAAAARARIHSARDAEPAVHGGARLLHRDGDTAGPHRGPRDRPRTSRRPRRRDALDRVLQWSREPHPLRLGLGSDRRASHPGVRLPGTGG